LNKAIKELQLTAKPLGRENIYKIAEHMGFYISEYKALEAMLFSRSATRDES
jgi:hypothetical protein